MTLLGVDLRGHFARSGQLLNARKSSRPDRVDAWLKGCPTFNVDEAGMLHAEIEYERAHWSKFIYKVASRLRKKEVKA